MTEMANPYTPGQPVHDPELFFGRRDVLASIRENLVKDRRVFVVSGARRMGKTSLLVHLQAHLPDGFVGVRLDLVEENAQRLDWLLWRVADAIVHQVGRQLGPQLPEPSWAEFEGSPEYLLEVLWPRVAGELGDGCLVLLLDDVDSLASDNTGLLEQFMDYLAVWREQDTRLALIVTTMAAQEDMLSRAYPRLFAGAPASVLAPLTSEEAIRLITWPVDGVLTYDYGIPRRLIEITSGQPYYLQLVCYEVVNRCGAVGWVNLRDVDLVLEDLVSREIADFRQVWDDSSPQEQAVLAALVSLRGARGVATVREVHTVLSKAGARARGDQVSDTLDSLASREILERLGALSYRFRVALLRDWLDERLDLQAVVHDTRWAAPRRGRREVEPRAAMLRTRRELERDAPQPDGVPEEEDEDAEEKATRRFGWGWITVAAALVLVLAAAVAFGLAGPWQSEPTATATTASVAAARTARLATVTLTPHDATARPSEGASPRVSPSSVPSPTATATPLPTFTPSPTPPVVVARSVPSIAYLTKPRGGEQWSLSVMSSNGSNRTSLTEAQSSFLSAPSWAQDGSAAVFVSDRDGSADIWRLDLDSGDTINLTLHESKHHSPAWSPDGELIAFASVRDSAYWELYTMRSDGSDVRRLTFWEDASDLSPAWSPDGTRLAFASKRDGNWEIYTMDLEGSNVLRLTDHPADDMHPAWSPDGSRIAFESARDGFTDIFVMPAIGGESVNVSNTSWATDLGPTWSPDGGRIAFCSDRDGAWNIHVMASDGSNVVTLTDSGTSDQLPAWRP
jgi:TolB protein